MNPNSSIQATVSTEPSPRSQTPRRRISWIKKLAFAVLATGLFLGVLELTLRLIGFRFLPRAPEGLINGQAVARMFRRTRTLVFEPIPRTDWFNADGFVGPVISRDRAAGTLRIATLGDSCTQFGDPPYATVLEEMLTERLVRPVDALNAGVAGYSSEQGQSRLEQKVLPYRPDVVTIYFGWNDHWIWDGFTDAERAVDDARTWRWLDYAGWSRIVQVGLSGAHMVHERRSWKLPRHPETLRVPVDRFRHNLRRMISLSRGISATPILVTAPSDMTFDTPFSAFDYLKSIDGTGYESPKQLHDVYIGAVRQVARDTNTRLVDAANTFDGRPGLMTHDHIHLTQDGVELIAELLSEEIVALLHADERRGSIDDQ